jgi:hypothetical protein
MDDQDLTASRRDLLRLAGLASFGAGRKPAPPFLPARRRRLCYHGSS